MHWFYIVPLSILGWASGSLVNYLSDVLPLRRKLVKPFCVHCNEAVSLRNYLLGPRWCLHCGKRRSWRVSLVVAFYILVTVLLWYNHPPKLGFWGGLILLIYFGLVCVIDFEYKLILHPVSIAGAGVGILIGSYLHGIMPTLIGGFVGFASMFLLYWLGELLLRLTARARGQSVDDVALGFGDVNLSGVLGLILGYPGIVLGLFLAILIGGVVSLIYLVLMLGLRRYQLFTALPYGPFLISGAVLLLFFRDTLAGFFN